MKKISFVVYYPYQWFIYKNIYSLLDKEKREVVVDLTVHQQMQQEGFREKISLLLDQEGVDYRVVSLLDARSPEYVKNFFTNVEVLVSCWEIGLISHIDTKQIKKINTTYGIAKELTLLRPSRSIYDVILAYGKRDQSYFSLMTKSIAIGNPRMDTFYTHGASVVMQQKIKNLFSQSNKKIILYVPTHGDLSSYKEMYATFSELSKKYNIIFKPHYFTLREDEEYIEKYKKISSLIVIDDSWDTVETIACADVVITDNSSVIFDIIQVDKPVIICDFLNINFLDVIHKQIRFAKRGAVGATTYSGSLEQEIKDKNMILKIKNPEELESVLENIDTLDKEYKKHRKKITEDYFEYTDGSSSKRARDIIMEIYANERNHIPGILHHAYLSYNQRTYGSLLSQKNDEQKIAMIESSKVVAWVYCSKHSTGNEVLSTVYSLLKEEIVTTICISGVENDILSNINFDDGLKNKIFLFKTHSDGVNLVSRLLKGAEYLLFVKPNTNVNGIMNMIQFQKSYGKEIIFFAENIFQNMRDSMYKLFLVFKYEVLRIKDISKNNVTAVSYERIHTIMKSGALIDASALINNELFKNEITSYERILSFFIMLESMKGQSYILMPNFLSNFQNKVELEGLYKKLVSIGLYLEIIGIHQKRWPDNNILRFLIKLIQGNSTYYYLLKLLFAKFLLVSRYKIELILRRKI